MFREIVLHIKKKKRMSDIHGIKHDAPSVMVSMLRYSKEMALSIRNGMADR